MDKLNEKISRLEGRLESLERLVDRLLVNGGSATTSSDLKEAVLPRLTVKQHVVLQMIMAGKSNADIGKRLNVTENTAKVHVRGIAKKYGVSTRSQIVMCALPEIESVSESQYQVMSGGIPRDWGEKLLTGSVSKDPYSKKYRG